MSKVFSREARNPVYNLLRKIMIESKGTASIDFCLQEANKASMSIDRSQIAAARNQYKRMAQAARDSGKDMPVVMPVEIKEEYSYPELEELAKEEMPEPTKHTGEEWYTPYIPEVDKNFHVNQQEEDFLKTIEKLSHKHYKEGIPSAKIRLIGPAGCGKTTMAIQYAAKYNRPCFMIDCQTLREALSLFGNKTVDKDGIKWVYSLFVKAVRTERAVIVMDEANRLAPMSMNTALPLLDRRAKVYFDESGEEIKAAKGVTFFCTLNEGSIYTGTEAMDGALKDRFSYIVNLDYLEEKEESKMLQKKFGLPANIANNFANIAKVIRDKHKAGQVYSNSLSTRVLELAAEMWMEGGDGSLKYSVANHFSCDGTTNSERNHVLELFKGKGFKV